MDEFRGKLIYLLVEPVLLRLRSGALSRVIESLSDAAKSMNLATNPVTISTEPGGAFSIFGGYITGRQIELVPSERIVQAWRVGNWAPGQYSLARFQLAANGVGTTLTFDHTGFPVGDGEHLSEGWVLNYWQPLTKFLG